MGVSTTRRLNSTETIKVGAWVAENALALAKLNSEGAAKKLLAETGIDMNNQGLRRLASDLGVTLRKFKGEEKPAKTATAIAAVAEAVSEIRKIVEALAERVERMETHKPIVVTHPLTPTRGPAVPTADRALVAHLGMLESYANGHTAG